jgi:hypothetical protein
MPAQSVNLYELKQGDNNMTLTSLAPINTKIIDREACGLLTHFILSGDGDIEENLVSNYMFFIGWSKPDGATVVDGVWNYPEDEPLEPVGIFSQGNKTLYVYPYAIVAVCVDGVLVKWTRCD